MHRALSAAHELASAAAVDALAAEGVLVTKPIGALEHDRPDVYAAMRMLRVGRWSLE